MWIVVLGLLLIAAQVNLASIVPAAPGQQPPPWWVGGGILWPFYSDTTTLIPAGDTLNSLTALLGIGSATLFGLAAASLLGWFINDSWFPWLVLAGALLSIPLHVVWISPWAILPLCVNVLLLWAVLAMHVTPTSLRA